jgi:hypothetical protein
VCGEHGTDREAPGGGADVAGADPAVGDQLGGLVQPAAVIAAGPPQVAGPVHLLGDVGQVEVGGEGAGQQDAGRHVEAGQALGGGAPVGAYQRPDLLDEVEERAPFLAHQRMAEQRAEPADVGAQGRVVLVVQFHNARD